MNENMVKIVIFSTLSILWFGSILFIMGPDIGLTTTVFPKPDYGFPIIIMIISGALLALYSFKTGVSYLRT